MAETDRPLTTARDVARVEGQIRDLSVLRQCMLQALDKQNLSVKTIGTCTSFAAGEAASASGSSTSASSDSSGSGDADLRVVHAVVARPSRLLLGDAFRTLGDMPTAGEPACAGALTLASRPTATALDAAAAGAAGDAPAHGCDAFYMKELDNPDLWPPSRFGHVQLLAAAIRAGALRDAIGQYVVICEDSVCCAALPTSSEAQAAADAWGLVGATVMHVGRRASSLHSAETFSVARTIAIPPSSPPASTLGSSVAGMR